jgi:aquaporin Z
MRKLIAEFLGTFLLVFGGCGSAVFSAAFPNVGIGLHGVSLAFGLTVVAGAYAFGPISGGHFNPAVSFGLAVGGRFSWKDFPKYVAAQLVGATIAAALLLLLLNNTEAGPYTGSLAANGYGKLSPGHFSMLAGFIAEVILTFIFLTVILGVTSKKSAPGFAGLVIGLTLTLVHLIGIPITNLSVNPARSFGPALFAGIEYMQQIWLFWVAPLIGAGLAGGLSKFLNDQDDPAAAAAPDAKA